MRKKYIVGTWANIRYEWLKKHHPSFCHQMEKEGELEHYLDAFQESYEIQAKRLADQLASERHVTEALSKSDFPKWILKTIKIQEDVLKEITKRICQ